MTPDERNLLGRFLADLGQARGGLRDTEAADMIDRAVRSNPDAAYLLVQHAIISDQALHAAQDRITQLEAQGRGAGQAAPGGGSFLGGGGAGYGAQQGYSQPQAQQTDAQPGYAQAPPRQGGGLLGGLFGGGGAPAQPGGFGSFLRTAGTAAAGVAGGEFLFNGLSNMFGGGRGGFGGGFGGPVENVTVNEYGGGGPGFEQGGFDQGGYDDGGFDNGGGFDDGGMN